MDSRSGGRSSHVRPRPASNGRPRPVRVRPVSPSPVRMERYRRVERRRSLPVPARAALALAVAVLSVGVLWLASGAVGPVVSGVARGLGGLVDAVGTVVSSPEPTSAPPVAGAPTVVPPEESYTNQEAVDVTVDVPAAIAGADGYTVRLWVTLPDQEPKELMTASVGQTAVVVVPGVPLSKGRNDIAASILGPGGESPRSEPATWILDQTRPSIKLTSPATEASTTTKDAVTVKGKTQGRSTVRLRNDLVGAAITTEAGTDGLFEAEVPVVAGINTITITSTDPAGNPNTATITVRKGSGSLLVSLSGTDYRFDRKKLPESVSFTVVVTGPDGRRVGGAVTLFTVTVPGLEAIVSGEIPTNRDGVATFTTTIPQGAQAGSGLATVLVTTVGAGQASDRQVLTVK